MESLSTDELSTEELLDRRAALLERGDEAHPGAAAEIAATRDALAARLAGAEPVVRRVGPDAPPALLERLVAAEAVHPFGGPQDLADRFDVDRRCYVLEHPELPRRPLNVVWCALVDERSRRRGVEAPPGGRLDDLGSILDPDAPAGDPTVADTAVFYSISTVEPGSVGLPGGRPLLEGAVAALRDELTTLTTFLTLSPVPGFRTWAAARGLDLAGDPRRRATAAAGYLTTLGDDGRPRDPVARFHLGNGARLLAVRPDADRSERGRARSWGLMANYRYAPEDRVANRGALARGRVPVSAEVADLAEEWNRPSGGRSGPPGRF